MTEEAIAALRQQAIALRAQATAVLMGADALLACLPAPQAPETTQAVPRTLGDD